MKLFEKIKNIIIGWYRYIFKSQSDFSKKRIEICKKCPHKIRVTGGDMCSLCGCFIMPKSAVANEICYDGRWNDIKINENETGEF